MTKTCSIEGCDKPLRASNAIGVCRAHRRQAAASREYNKEYHSRPEVLARARQRNASEERRAKKSAQQKKRYAEDAEYRARDAEAKRVYYEKNKAAAIERANAWQIANPERRAEIRQAWSRQNKDSVNQQTRLRRLRLAQAEGSYTQDEWEAILAYYGYTCPGCGRDDVKLTVDHVQSVSQGGTNHATNIQPLCCECNSRKGTRTIRFRPWPQSSSSVCA